MCFKMDTLQLFYLLIIVFGIAAVITAVSSCPTLCTCRGSVGACSPGLTDWPYGFTGIVTSLSLSGLPSKHNTLHHIQRQPNLLILVNLTRLDITYSEVTAVVDNAFVGLTKLNDLSLADNELRSLNENTFRGLPNLRTLDLSGNQNCQFNKTVFSPINTIEELNLGDMNITMLPVDIFSELNDLKVLKLYSNRLKTISSKHLEPLSFLESLDLSENLLRNLPQTLKPVLNKLKGLHLSDNPWECSCQLYWFRELKKEFLINTVNGGEVICHEPDTIKYTAFVSVPYVEFLCRPPKVLRCDSNMYRIEVHHTVVVSCEFEGSPVPEVKWVQPGGKEFINAVITDGQHFVMENGTLLINGASIADNGQWIFLVSNGTAYDMAYVTVEVVTKITSTLSMSPTTTPTVKTIGKSTKSSTTAATPHFTNKTKMTTIATQSTELSSSSTEYPTSSALKSTLSPASTLSALPTSVTQNLTKRTAKLLTIINPSTKLSSSTIRLSSSSVPQSTLSSTWTSSALPTSVVLTPAIRRPVTNVKSSTTTSSSATKLPAPATHSTRSSTSTSSSVPHRRYMSFILFGLISID